MGGHVRGRVLRAGRSSWLRRGASLLLVLYSRLGRVSSASPASPESRETPTTGPALSGRRSGLADPLPSAGPAVLGSEPPPSPPSGSRRGSLPQLPAERSRGGCASRRRSSEPLDPGQAPPGVPARPGAASSGAADHVSTRSTAARQRVAALLASRPFADSGSPCGDPAIRRPAAPSCAGRRIVSGAPGRGREGRRSLRELLSATPAQSARGRKRAAF